MRAPTYLVAGLLLASALVVPAVVPTTAVYAAVNQAEQVSKIEIPIDTVKRGDQGSRVNLLTKEVANGEYNVKVTARNQGSVHPDSNLYVISGDSVVKIADVEQEANKDKHGEGVLNVTNGRVVVELQFGPHKIFSGGLKVVLEQIVQPEPVDVCDPETGEVITVKENEVDDYLPVDADECQPPVEEEPEVEEPKVEGVVDEEPKQEAPQELPKTGVASLFGGVVGAGSVAYATQMYRTSVRRLNK